MDEKLKNEENFDHDKNVKDNSIGVDMYIPKKEMLLKKIRENSFFFKCSRKLYSIKSLIFGFSFTSLSLLFLSLGVIFLIFSTLNSISSFTNKRKLSMKYLTERSTKWLNQGPVLIRALGNHFVRSVENGLYDSWNMYTNYSKGKADFDDLMDIVWLEVNGTSNMLGGSILLENGVVVMANHIGAASREYFGDYNSTLGYKGIYTKRINVNRSLSHHGYYGSVNYSKVIISNTYDPQHDESIQWYMKNEDYDDFVWKNYLVRSSYTDKLKKIMLYAEVTTITKRFVDYNGNYRGVAAAWFGIEQFYNFIVDLNSDGNVIMIDIDTGLMLASSYLYSGGIVKSTSRERAESYVQNRLIRFISSSILSYYGNYSNVKDVEMFHLVDFVGLSMKLISCSSISVANFNILIIYIGDVCNIFSYVFVGNAISITIAFCVTIGAIFISYCASYIFLRPLYHTINSLKHVETLEFDKIKLSSHGISIIHEVKLLNERVIFMLDKLQEFKSFIPVSIKTNNYHNKDDCDSDHSSSGSNRSSNSSSSSSSSSSSGGESDESSIPSKLNANTSSKATLTEFLINKMSVNLKLQEGNVLIVYFLFDDIHRWLEYGKIEEYIEFYDRFIKFILEKCRGNVIKVDYYCVVLFYRISMLCFRNAIAIKEYLNAENIQIRKKISDVENKTSQEYLGNINFNILIDRNHFFKGIIGNSLIKLPAVLYKSSLYENILYFCSKNEIIVTQKASQHYNPDLLIPIDIIKIDFGKTCVLYTIIKDENANVYEKITVKNVKSATINYEELQRKGFFHFERREWENVVNVLKR